MPKSSGQDMKTVRAAPPPKPKARPIMRFKQPAPAAPPPHPSAKQLVDQVKRIASTPGEIDPRQRHF
jgi:hypothetical protein